MVVAPRPKKTPKIKLRKMRLRNEVDKIVQIEKDKK